MKNNIFSGLASSIEWFDFALYGFFGTIFSEIFFSSTNKTEWLSLIITYIIFAIGFAARPIGALIFGYIGDKYGRTASLKITPILITITTATIAFLPTYQTVGNVAIFLLLITRIIQGVLLGGEFAGNIVYLCESGNRWRYLLGSLGSCTSSFGIILASILASTFFKVFDHTFMYHYGWRIAFLCATPLGIFSCFMRLKLTEPAEFFKNSRFKNPIKVIIKQYKKRFFYCLGIVYLHTMSFYFVFIFLPIFLTRFRHLTQSAALIKNTVFLMIHLCFIPLFGILVNIIGGLRSLIYIALVFTIFSIPLFYFLAYKTGTIISICLFILSILTAFNAAVIPGLLVGLIPKNIRFTMLALVFNIGFGVFGGTAPLISLLLINKSQSIISPGVYLTVAAAITLISGLIFAKNRLDHEAREI